MKKVYFYLYLLIFIFLALPMIKVFGSARVEQLLLLATFVVLFVEDTIHKKIDFKIFITLIVGGVILVLVSLNSAYDKVEETNRFIKFLFIYPLAFYVGAAMLRKLALKEIVTLLDLSLLFYVVSWLIVMYVPLPMDLLGKFVHLREFGWGDEFLPFQGTFYEAGALAIIVGSVSLTSFLIRYEFDIWFSKRRYNYLLYTLVLYMIILSKNKTIWLALVMILISLVLYRLYLRTTRSNHYYSDELLNKDPILSKFLKLKVSYLVIGALMLVLLFFVYNSFSPEPIITMDMFEYKLKHERGAQYAITWDLIEKSNYFGGYGFGFVEVYFEGLNILGVGAESGSINNIFLDIWLQASILGVIYLLVVFYLSFDNRLFLTMTIPLFFLFFGLTNPVVSEEFFLMLGISYGFSNMIRSRTRPVNFEEIKC